MIEVEPSIDHSKFDLDEFNQYLLSDEKQGRVRLGVSEEVNRSAEDNRSHGQRFISNSSSSPDVSPYSLNTKICN